MPFFNGKGKGAIIIIRIIIFLQTEKLYVMRKTRGRSTFKSDHGVSNLGLFFWKCSKIIFSTKSRVILI